MLKTNHLEDYIVKKEDGKETVELGGNHGHRCLNEDLLTRKDFFMDLNEGYTKESTEDKGDERKLDVFLKWMIEKSPEGDIEMVLNGAKFVCRRGVLVRIAQGEYLASSKGDWVVACVRRKDAIYLEEEQAQSEIRRKANVCDEERASWYWGHRFEKYMLLDPLSEGESKDDNLTKDRLNPGIRMVMSATLASCPGSAKPESVNLLYSGEIDAIDSDGRYVDLKTAKSESLSYGYWFWKEKSIRWWLQSRLVDIDYLVVGNRDKYGNVHSVAKMKLRELEGSTWNSENCLAFLLRVLVFIDKILEEGETVKVIFTGGRFGLKKPGPGEAPIITKEFIDHFGL